ncbi:RagB/SusD family nutrient uptake outer membrane protein [Flammeovirga agarivorans]|uniref:RagB/SusD family nutrient uptake outer membrane protein n=1 Tax=Flammeovirga agarivorans TaxID=2726742 RepID=A0A7X8SHK6_9BACT|nr:RagB/SusD family nutrient uptake outer membrane protein [Flammeovirga agarivorans]NLR90329.1 RagB/SusD family nutrient uptake outer membrane protein [Flammeovirga agarivorans]
MKIKDILVAGSILVGVMSTTSCTQYLELTPTDKQSADTFFKTSTEAKQALVGIYEKLRSDYNGYTNSVQFFDMAMGDDSYVGGDPSGTDMIEYQRIMRFSAQTNNYAAQVAWNKCYGGIQRANTLLANYDNIDFTTAEEDIKNNYKGEALFLRAHFYFELVRLFENIPMYTEPLIGDAWKELEQATPEAVYAQIAQDMNDAVALMATEAPEGDEGRLTKYAAEAELAKVFLFYTGYYNKTSLPTTSGAEITSSQVVTMLEDVIANSGASLVTDYADLFNQNGNYNTEAIFEIAFANTGSGDWGDYSYGNMFCQVNGPRGHNSDILVQGWGFNSPSRDLETSFEDGDARKAATIVYAKDLIDAAGSIYQANYNFTSMHGFKYTTHKWNQADVNVELNWAQNFQYIRLADVLLMAAELTVDSNNGQASGYVNQVRNRAGLASISGVTLEDIKQERRVELAHEGHRYFDVLRWSNGNMANVSSEINVSNYTLTPPTETDATYIDDQGQNLTGDLGNATDFEITFDESKKGFLPIPQSEIDLHPMLKQNAGY